MTRENLDRISRQAQDAQLADARRMTTNTRGSTPDTFDYSPWRHGGWYVGNVRYPSGAVGCVSRNYSDRKWRIVCDSRERDFEGKSIHTYPNRDAAAAAERDLIAAGVLR